MKQIDSIRTALTLISLLFILNVHAQEESKIESVKISIDQIIDNIYHAADTIEHIDQINSIYEAGAYAKLKNLIEYYDDLGGSEEQVAKYNVHYTVLGDRLQTRKHNIDIGNIVDLKYQAEVEADIKDLTSQLETADASNIRSIQRDFELVQKVFDIGMRHNTVVEEWKQITREKLLRLQESIEEKSKMIGN